MPTASQFALWKRERLNPMPVEDRQQRSTSADLMLGYWRIEGSRTKSDYPVAISQDDGQKSVTVQIGRFQIPTTTEELGDEWDQFLTGSWLKCRAVTYEEWVRAMENGQWDDGKAAGKADEKAAATDEAGNAAPIEEQLRDEIAALAEVIEKQGEPKNQAAADKLAGDLDRMRVLLKDAEAERTKEKAPVIQQGKDIDARWSNVAGPGKAAYEAGDSAKRTFLKKETERKRREAEEENRKREAAAAAERKRIADEEAERLRKIAADRAAEAEPGEEAPPVPTEEEIAARAAEVAEQSVAPVEHVVAERVVAGSAYGTRRGLKKVTKGQIDDAEKFAVALVKIKHGELMTLLQTLADRAAKAGLPQDGMTIITVEE